MKIKNERHAIYLSLSLWHWCAITGKSKKQYPRFFEDKYNEFSCACAQCEYITSRNKSCSDCFLSSICNNELNLWRIAVERNNINKAKKYANRIFETVYQKAVEVH